MNEHRECWEGKFRSKRSKKFLLFLDQKKIKTSSSRPRFDCQLYSQHFFRFPPPPPEKYRFMIKILMWWTQRPLTFCSSTWLIGCFKCSASYISQEKWQCFYAVFTMGVCGDGTFPFPPPLIFLIFLTCFRVMQSGEYLRGKRAVSIALDELVLVLLKAYKLTGVALDSD